jgi:hypothetical protein
MTIFKTSLLAVCLLYCLNLSAKITFPDTLHVVREDQFLRYPFGIFRDFRSFNKERAKAIPSKGADVKPYKNGRKEQTKMFTAIKSYTRFYLDRNTKNLETVSAIILGGEIPLQNSIMIGMDRTEFLKKLNIPDSGAVKAGTVELTSKTGDIHHYYDFQNGKLIRIMIFSHLFYQKE